MKNNPHAHHSVVCNYGQGSSFRHIVLHHASTGLGACALAFALSWWWEGANPIPENVSDDMGRTEFLGSLFFGLHIAHIFFASTTFVLIYWLVTNGCVRRIVPLGVSVSLVTCTLNDIIFPYTGALIVGVQDISLHICIVQHPLMTVAPALFGSFLGTHLAKRGFFPTRIGHGGHVMISSIACLTYLMAFSHLEIRENTLALGILTVITMFLHCTISDLFLPTILGKKFAQHEFGVYNTAWLLAVCRKKVLVIIILLFTINHIEHYLRVQKIHKNLELEEVSVVRAINNVTSHQSLLIEERKVRSGYLYFNTLETWEFSKDTPTPCPEDIMAVNGQQVKLMGFMFPLQEADELTTFCLLRSTQTCCYGPRPQFNQYVLVEMTTPVKFERLAPVVVEGKFFVDAKPNEGYIYRMEGQVVRSAVHNDQPLSAIEFAQQNGLPIFDFSPLEAVKLADDKKADIARLAASLEGKTMVVNGFIVGKTDGSLPKVMIGKYYWDGKTQGTPAGFYNTVLISPITPNDLPPLWWQEAVYKGTIHVNQDASLRGENGIVSLHNATLAVPKPDFLTDSGPMIPPMYEFMILAGVLVFGRLSKKSRNVSGDNH